MDLKDIAVIVGIIKDVVLAVAAVVTALVAVRGVSGWLRELRGRTEFESALALMKATYSLREALFSCRAPLILAGEFPSGYSQVTDGSNAEKKGKAYAHVLGERWSAVVATLSEFDARSLESEAIWGKDIRDATESLRKDVNTLYAAIVSYIDDAYIGGENFKEDPAFGIRVRRDVFASRDASDNALSNRILSNIQRIEMFASPHLGRP
ncbi:hypothetical protein N0A02_06690 [Paraburkholderia acidicola]|uniref:Uncharacterized protein n=1 Tax=Paraburkholderia acidicola TaxID=1912599 RepID=A0ABV1LIL4_9BURK